MGEDVEQDTSVILWACCERAIDRGTDGTGDEDQIHDVDPDSAAPQNCS